MFKVIQQRELEDYAVTEENKYLFDLLNSKDFKKEKAEGFKESRFALTTQNKSTRFNMSIFTKQFLNVLKELNTTYIYIFFELNESWFHQKNSYPPVKKALLILKKYIKSKNNYDGIKLNIDELPEFIRILYWLVRCNASLPKIWINPISSKILFHLNKYGNMQYLLSNNSDENIFLNLFHKNGFKKIEYSKICFSKITGRN